MAPRAQKPAGTADHFTEPVRAMACRSRFGGADGGPDPGSPRLSLLDAFAGDAWATEDGRRNEPNAAISASVTTRRERRVPLDMRRGSASERRTLNRPCGAVTVDQP